MRSREASGSGWRGFRGAVEPVAGRIGSALAIALVVGLVMPVEAFASHVVGTVPPPVTAANSPMEFLKKINEKIGKIIEKKVQKDSEAEKKQDEKLKKVVNKLLDFKALTKSALGKHWGSMSEAQQQEMVTLLTELIQKNYVKQIHQRKDEKYIVEYKSETIENDEATVVTLVIAEERHDEETELVYKLKKKGTKWMVVDIETDGVSLVRNYRSQFSKIIEKDGISKLLEKMRKKVESGDTSDL